MTLPREILILGVISVVLPTWLITLVYSELDFAVMLDAFPIPLLFLVTGQVPVALAVHLGSRHPRATTIVCLVFYLISLLFAWGVMNALPPAHRYCGPPRSTHAAR